MATRAVEWDEETTICKQKYAEQKGLHIACSFDRRCKMEGDKRMLKIICCSSLRSDFTHLVCGGLPRGLEAASNLVARALLDEDGDQQWPHWLGTVIGMYIAQQEARTGMKILWDEIRAASRIKKTRGVSKSKP